VKHSFHLNILIVTCYIVGMYSMSIGVNAFLVRALLW
jgi:hypothetical protein